MSNFPTLHNPCCCGITLQSGVKIIASIHIFSSGLLFLIFCALPFLVDGEMSAGFVVVWLIATAIIGGLLGVNVLLFKGANQRAAKKVKIYLIYHASVIVLSWLLLLYQLFTGNFFLTASPSLFFYYAGWVVYCFYKELLSESLGEVSGDLNKVETGYNPDTGYN